MPGDVEQQRLRDQFVVVEHVAVVLGVDERGEQVVGWVGPLPRDHLRRYLGQLVVGGHYRGDQGRVSHRLQRADHRAGQLPDPLVVGWRRAEHLGDHANGNGNASASTRSTRPCPSTCIEHAVDQLGDPRPQRLDGPRRERLGHQPAQPGVVGRIPV